MSAGLIGCLNGSGVTSKNYKEILVNMARASTGKAQLDGMRRRSKDAKSSYLSPRKKGNRLQKELKNSKYNKSGQSHKKR
jgi:catalase